MIRQISALILCCFAICGLAQEHLTFKGIPITGAMTVFCERLKDKGFVQIEPEDSNFYLFEGVFTGSQVTVGAMATDNGQDVYTVAVFFDESDSWNTLVNTYEYYKDLYTEKYGSPTKCVEINPSDNDSNTSLMYELFQDRASYTCIFEPSGGTIQISINKGRFGNGVVMITYMDSQNISTKRQSDLDEI